jgi:sarcosine oxidase subunit alpha
VKRTLRNPVVIRFDGDEVEAERGEPVAAALVAAGKLAIARSPKFHRPRGPSCFRAACDGCLARVDGVPNVMTCLAPARDGMTIEAQNTLGSREVDLLRMTDWFFPRGMNHHELFAGVPGVQRVMQAFARRVAGLGKLPEAGGETTHARRRAVDALVVGAGPAGMTAAMALADRGRAVEVVDDALEPGGTARAMLDGRFDALVSKFAEYTQKSAKNPVEMRSRTTAGAVYGDDVMIVSEGGAEILNAKTLVLATGAHDGVLAFEGNDVPGVMSARAGAWLARAGVDLGGRVVVAVVDGGGPFGEVYAENAKGVTLVREAPTKVSGSSRVKRVAFGKKEIAASALLIDAPRAPAYELAEQAGAELEHESRGYVVRADGGKIRDGVFVVGELAGTPLDATAIAREVAAIRF